MQIVGTPDQAHPLMPLAVCAATPEGKEVVRWSLAALCQEAGKDGKPCTLITGMAHHAGAFGDQLIAEIPGMEVADCFFEFAKKVHDNAPILRSFYKPLIATVRLQHQLPSTTLQNQRNEAGPDPHGHVWVTWGVYLPYVLIWIRYFTQWFYHV